jgi:hypothetical protein
MKIGRKNLSPLLLKSRRDATTVMRVLQHNPEAPQKPNKITVIIQPPPDPTKNCEIKKPSPTSKSKPHPQQSLLQQRSAERTSLHCCSN